MNDDTNPYDRTDSRATSQSERTEAMLAHVLTVFVGFIAPAVMYFAKRERSRFVAFHALQAFLWHLLTMIVFLGAVVAMIAIVGFGAFHHPTGLTAEHQGAAMPITMMIAFFGCWLLLMGGWLVNTGFAVYVAIKANSGHWTRYPVIGALAARMGHYDEAAGSSL